MPLIMFVSSSFNTYVNLPKKKDMVIIKHGLSEENLWDKPVICKRDHKRGATAASGGLELLLQVGDFHHPF
jgi:hypothetical protein